MELNDFVAVFVLLIINYNFLLMSFLCYTLLKKKKQSGGECYEIFAIKCTLLS